jgi:hypothetical protein
LRRYSPILRAYRAIRHDLLSAPLHGGSETATVDGATLSPCSGAVVSVCDG